MNTATTTRWIHTVMIAAALAACFIAQHAVAAPAPATVDNGRVVTLPRVVVTGRHVQPQQVAVVQLPRVVVIGRHIDADAAQAKRDEPAAKRATLVAMR
jgi:hypothetical protein